MPCLTFSVHFLVLTEQVSPVGSSQSALIALVGEEQWVGVWCIPGRGRGSESEVVFGQAFRSEGPSGGGPELEVSAVPP